MTYLAFHSIFNFPLLVLLFLLNARWPWAVEEKIILGVLLAVVMVFTSPWDNHAAKKNIWGFPKGRYWFKIAYLPFEEYLFFILQTLNIVLLTRYILYAAPHWRSGAATPLGQTQIIGLAIFLMAWAGVGVWLWKRRPALKWSYTIHLLYWFAPVIAIQWILGFSLFIAALPCWLIPTLAFGCYYTVADWIAVRSGTWIFDHAQITGIKLGQYLPWEEVAFFFLTSLIVSQSYLLLLPQEMR